SGRDLGVAPDALAAQLGLNPGAAGLIEHELFGSIYNPGKLLLLAGWRGERAAQSFAPARPAAAAALRHRGVRIIRDYGMFERREAPQFYPEVKRAEQGRRAAGGTHLSCRSLHCRPRVCGGPGVQSRRET